MRTPPWAISITAALPLLIAGPGFSSAQSLNSVTPFTGTPSDHPPSLPLFGNGGPLSGGSGYTIADAAAADKLDAVTALLGGGANVDDADGQGRTGLIYAAIDNDAAIAHLLLDHDARPSAADTLGYTALHWAAERGSLDVLRLLIAAKAPIDAQNRQGITPLMLAAGNGRTEAVRLLLGAHADPTKEDYTGRDAVGWAGDRQGIVQLLKK